MFKGSGLIRTNPRLNARTRQDTAASNGTTRPAQTILYLVISSTGFLCLAFSGILITTLVALHVAFPNAAARPIMAYQGAYPGIILAYPGQDLCASYTIPPYAQEEACDLRLIESSADTFSKVTRAIRDGHFGSVSFQCRGILVGDLVDQWGRPDDITRVPGGYLLLWSHKSIIAQVRGRQWFNYQLPVTTVILT